MKEIEVKAKLKDPDFMMNKLKDLGCEFSEPIVQKDKIFLEKNEDFLNVNSERNVFRIREQNGKFILTLKKAQSNELDCIERETVIEDAEQIKDMLTYLGYKEFVRYSKKRKKCKYKEYEICLDEVDELGTFIEVERMSEDDASKIQEELLKFLLSLGIEKEDMIVKGYDTMIFKQKGEINE